MASFFIRRKYFEWSESKNTVQTCLRELNFCKHLQIRCLTNSKLLLIKNLFYANNSEVGNWQNKSNAKNTGFTV